MQTRYIKQTFSLLGCGAALPQTTYSNQQLLAILLSKSGPRKRLLAAKLGHLIGVQKRHLSRNFNQNLGTPSPTAIELGQRAINQALASAKLNINHCQYLLTHTCTPHTQVPPNASWLADELQFTGPYLELRQACTGFANALQIAAGMLPTNTSSHGRSASKTTSSINFESAEQAPVVICGMETGSVYFDFDDEFIDLSQLLNYMQMGDGAGAVILANSGHPQAIGEISHGYFGHIGIGKQPGFYLDGGSAKVKNKEIPKFHHDVKGVRQNGEMLIKHSLEQVLHNQFSIDDFDFILPHQANGHIDEIFAKQLGIDKKKVINHAKELGNLGSAAIWVSLNKLIRSGKLATGSRVLVVGAEATKYLYGGFVYTHT
ncbi:3-oxoacyl-ACP synthase III family protein [Paraferrimonas sp. SM1919]|uniref:3-oxoacyl-ACP synthase III family protein n=1 Tax=Paraferrimonas sp. SM1919 TaxID=2662263 RepID=UPI0013D04F46|nr:3-oxoacyl-[acyl-carrier-protein] synthase III C-terminal domain-containing protein [Paraferrimonas sp. SM1919]